MAQGKKKISRLKIKKSTAAYLLAAAAILIYLTAKMLPERTVFIYAEKKTAYENVKIYTFKEEEYVYIDSDSNIDFLYDAGTKVSASTVLSDDYTINTDVYLNQKIAIIDYMLANPELDTREKMYARMSGIRAQLEALDYQIDEAESKADIEAKRVLMAQRQEYQNLYDILKGAMQYILTQDDALYALRSEYAAMIGGGGIPLTLGNLNFTVFGYLSYATDGYENAMNFDNLLSVDAAYLDTIDQMTPIGSENLDKYVVKSTATNKIVLVFALPLDTAVTGEVAAVDRYDALYSSYDIDGEEGGYYQFLFRRIDLLNGFPAISIKLKDDNIYSGYLINIQRNENEKLVFVAFRDDIGAFLSLRLFNADVATETYSGFVIPKSCLSKESDIYYITVLTGAAEKQKVAVTVYKESGNNVILRCEDNPDLVSGTEILYRGK